MKKQLDISMENKIKFIESKGFKKEEGSRQYKNGNIYNDGTIGVIVYDKQVTVTKYYHPNTQTMQFHIETLADLKTLFKFMNI